MNNGSIGFGLVLVATGAILAWAVEATVSGVDLKVIGAILMVVGALAVALSLLFWASFAPFARQDRPRHTGQIGGRRETTTTITTSTPDQAPAPPPGVDVRASAQPRPNQIDR